MTKRIKGLCPCGYGFETLSSKTEAVKLVQLHVEQFHQDLLPFGITVEEASMLLKTENVQPPVKQAHNLPIFKFEDSSQANKKSKEQLII